MRSTPQEPAPLPTAEPAPRSAPAPDARLEPSAGGITGVHAIVFTPAAAQVRAFFRDALGLPNVDAGDGWQIFALPPAELAVHPADAPNHEIYLMCDDLEATLASLERKGVEVRRPVREEAWGFVTEIVLPGGTELAIYQPKHPSPLALPREPRS
jgi:predicted enzyme related to lactoylglutathione lyase